MFKFLFRESEPFVPQGNHVSVRSHPNTEQYICIDCKKVPKTLSECYVTKVGWNQEQLWLVCPDCYKPLVCKNLF